MASAKAKLKDHRLSGVALRSTPVTKPIAIGRSKLGGHPDVPADFVWPTATRTGNGKSLTAPLAFLAQIRLADVARHDRDHLLPASGLLLFFTLDVLRVYCVIGKVKKGKKYLPVETATFVTHLPRGTKLARRSPPADLPASHVGPETKLAFRRVDTWPQVEGVVLGAPGRGPVKLSKAEWTSWAGDEEHEPPRQGMLGHAHGCEFPIGDDPHERLLLSIDVKESGLPWDLFGRNGFLFFHMREDAMRGARWETVRHKEW
jgi:hypothetical protein